MLNLFIHSHRFPLYTLHLIYIPSETPPLPPPICSFVNISSCSLVLQPSFPSLLNLLCASHWQLCFVAGQIVCSWCDHVTCLEMVVGVICNAEDATGCLAVIMQNCTNSYLGPKFTNHKGIFADYTSECWTVRAFFSP